MTTKVHGVVTPPVTQEKTTDDVVVKPVTVTQKKRFHDDKLMLSTLLIAATITVLLYTVPDWVFLEIPTRDIIHMLLNFAGIENSLIPNGNPTRIIPEFLRGGLFPFLEATTKTPGIYIPSTNGDYWIVKACTGMQAGGLLIALIIVTEAPWLARLRASIAFLIALFIGNALRIAFHLWSVHFLVTQIGMDAETAFYWAHDVSSKVIGFFGTIFFAFLIEKWGPVPIIDQFADWLDYFWYRISSLYSWVLGNR
ncbi:MAG: heimdallarchaeosortase [Candidatus Thorarchaeota archaeon]